MPTGYKEYKKMSNHVSASIVLPAINETYSLKQTVEIILNTCRREDICEFFIVLCSKSAPECVMAAHDIHQQVNSNVPVRIYYQKKPFIGAAMQEAFDLVKGTHVVMMSTDLETDPRLVAPFIEKVKEKPDAIVTASRWVRGGSFRGYSPLKLLANFVFQKAIALMFFSKLTDLTYGYRIFPTSLVQRIRWEEAKHPFFLETALKPLRTGTKFYQIPAQWEARTEGESQNSFFKNFAYFRVAFKVRFMSKSKIVKPS
jgi:hypothetical protein